LVFDLFERRRTLQGVLQSLAAQEIRPELTNWPFYTHKRTKCERQAALVRVSGGGRSGLIPSLFSDVPFVVPQT
jgi:hypothetical protein